MEPQKEEPKKPARVSIEESMISAIQAVSDRGVFVSFQVDAKRIPPVVNNLERKFMIAMKVDQKLLELSESKRTQFKENQPKDEKGEGNFLKTLANDYNTALNFRKEPKDMTRRINDALVGQKLDAKVTEDEVKEALKPSVEDVLIAHARDYGQYEAFIKNRARSQMNLPDLTAAELLAETHKKQTEKKNALVKDLKDPAKGEKDLKEKIAEFNKVKFTPAEVNKRIAAAKVELQKEAEQKKDEPPKVPPKKNLDKKIDGPVTDLVRFSSADVSSDAWIVDGFAPPSSLALPPLPADKGR